MHVLLLRPVSPNERFGLGPFFRVEPLGLEYIAAALLDQGHRVRIVDLRFAPGIADALRADPPDLVGITCAHAVDIPSAISLAHTIKRAAPQAAVVLGGHAAAMTPSTFAYHPVDLVCVGDGEHAFPSLTRALEQRLPLDLVPGFVVPDGDACVPTVRESLDLVPLPARHLVAHHRKHYACVHKMPLWAVETARGCPHRCSFCSVWASCGRTFRCRCVDAVCRDFQSVGDNIFVVDDLFWYPYDRSAELARELARRGIRKDWVLVQTRLDTVAKHPTLLEAWRPFARLFDIFFGFEAPRADQLRALQKDMSIEAMEEGVAVARSFGYGVTGNFVVDPDWTEDDFEAMWALVDRLELNRAGYTILTPLPGTELFRRWKPRLLDHDWARYDMHHLLFEPRLGRKRFFELFAESWRRNVLGPRYAGAKWWRWARELEPRQALVLARVLYRTQRMLDPDAYLRETFPAMVGAPAMPAASATHHAPPRPDSNTGDVLPPARPPTAATTKSSSAKHG